MGAGFGIDTSGWLHRDNDDMLAPEVAAFWSGKPRVSYYCRRITVILGIILQWGVIHASRGHLSSRITRYPPEDEFGNSSSGAYILIRPSLARLRRRPPLHLQDVPMMVLRIQMFVHSRNSMLLDQNTSEPTARLVYIRFRLWRLSPGLFCSAWFNWLGWEFAVHVVCGGTFSFNFFGTFGRLLPNTTTPLLRARNPPSILVR